MGVKDKQLGCNFCGISGDNPNVIAMISAPSVYKVKAYICDACVMVSLRIVLDHAEKKASESAQRAAQYLAEVSAQGVGGQNPTDIGKVLEK